MKPEVLYIRDADVDDALDQEIRGLLTTCFTGPQDWVFKERRYYKDPYPHRWIIRDAQGAMVAHVGGHDREVLADGSSFRIGGIGEVCVHPNYRGRGFVRAMLLEIHDELTQWGFDFALLFGAPNVYGSSGYIEVHNLFHGEGQPEERVPITAMVKELSGKPWPNTKVYLPGQVF